MKSLFLFLVLPTSGFAAGMAPVAPAAPEVPRIIVPGAPAGASGAPLILPQGSIIIAVPSTVIIPQAPVILAPPPLIVPASRPLSEAEAAQTKAPSQEELQKLVAGLSSRDESSPNAHAAGGAFDGSAAAEPRAVLDISYFGSQPLAPSLSKVEDAARAVMGHLLPRFYRPIPSASAYADDKITGHTWTPDNGHLIELSPVAADSSGEVPSAFGFPGAVRVQQRIERFMEYSHELAHVLFDDGVRKTQTHSPRSAYAAMTEGFAVALEQILIERMLAQPVALHLSPRDAMDLAAISRARTQWLASMDTHYSEGILSWRKAYERGGETGMLTLLSSLSSRRMTDTMRSDPLYQLTLGDPTLLSTYLGKKWDGRRELDAGVVDAAGPEGWRRLFDRTLLADKNLAEPTIANPSQEWWKKDEPKPTVTVEPAFAAARVSPSAAAALANYLLEIIQAPGGAKRLFERPGPNAKLNAIAAGAEALPWKEAARSAWMEALSRWLSLT